MIKLSLSACCVENISEWFLSIDLIRFSKLIWFSFSVWIIQLFVLFFSLRWQISSVRYFSFDFSWNCVLLPSLLFTEFFNKKNLLYYKRFHHFHLHSYFSEFFIECCYFILLIFGLSNCDGVLHIIGESDFSATIDPSVLRGSSFSIFSM